MTATQDEILNLLIQGPLGPSAIAAHLKISRQALHRHLKVLLKNKLLKTEGKTPHLVYHLANRSVESRIKESYELFEGNILPAYLKKNSFEKAYKQFCDEHEKLKAPNFAFMLDSAAVYSSNIEGNSLNLNSFLNSRLQNKKIRPREAQEIEDLVDAYKFIQSQPLNEKNMLKAHGMLSRGFLNKTRQGVYRKEPVGVFSARGLEYLALEQHLVPTELHNLFAIIDELLKKPVRPMESFFWASWLHLMMALIHPFADGNGRIARLCEKWFLVKKLGKMAVFLPSEENYWKNRPDYYAALKLGVNYWEVDFKKSGPFINLLPGALE